MHWKPLVIKMHWKPLVMRRKEKAVRDSAVVVMLMMAQTTAWGRNGSKAEEPDPSGGKIPVNDTKSVCVAE